MCQDGARLVHDNAITNLESEHLTVFVIWLSKYPGDNRDKAVDGTRIVPDERATHYWDSNGYVPKQFGVALGLPEGKQFAWDTYMIFGADAVWKDKLPVPHDWMHQLSSLGKEHERWLDGDRFRKALLSVIE